MSTPPPIPPPPPPSRVSDVAQRRRDAVAAIAERIVSAIVAAAVWLSATVKAAFRPRQEHPDGPHGAKEVWGEDSRIGVAEALPTIPRYFRAAGGRSIAIQVALAVWTIFGGGRCLLLYLDELSERQRLGDVYFEALHSFSIWTSWQVSFFVWFTFALPLFIVAVILFGRR